MKSKNLTPVTKERFYKWLEKRKIQKDKEWKENIKKQLEEMGIKTNKKKMTGKELFSK